MDSLPKPNKDDLESIAAQLLQKVFGAKDPALKYGRSGQAQHGVDVTVRIAEGVIGAQCKAYTATPLTPAVLEEELRKAHTFDPALYRYVIVTSAPRDGKLSTWAFKARLDGRPAVQIWMWEDICDLLEQHDLLGEYLLKVLPVKALPSLIKAVGLESTLIFSSGSVATDADAQDEFAELLATGRAEAVVDSLSNNHPTEAERFALARALVQLQRDDDARIALIGCGGKKATALQALVAARLGDSRGSEEAIQAAFDQADSRDLGYIAAIAILRQLVADPDITLEGLASFVPTAVREHPAVLGALGDVASQRENHELAIELYRKAERLDRRPSTLRRVAILGNRLAGALSTISSGAFTVSEATVRSELQSIRSAMRQELLEPIGTHLRAVLLFNDHSAALALGELGEALNSITQAIELKATDLAFWRRWALVSILRQSDVDADFMQCAPIDATLDLMLADVEVLGGDRQKARARIQRALSTEGLDSALEARLIARQITLAGDDDHLTPQMASELFELTKSLRTPAPAVVRLVTALNQPGIEEIAKAFFQWLNAADLQGLEEDDQLALVAAMIEEGHGREACRFLDLLRRRTYRADGSIDAGVAPLLIRVASATLRRHEAAKVAKELATAGSSYGLLLRASALEQFGEPAQALKELLESHATQQSVSLLRRAAELGVLTNRLPQVRRILRSWSLPRVESAEAASALYDTLVTLHDPRREALAEATLRSTEGIHDLANTLVASTLRSRRSISRRVSANSLVTVRLSGGSQAEYWVGEGHSPSQTAPGVNWLTPILGFEVGDSIELSIGPFAGQSATILATKRPEQILFERAIESASASGSVRSYNGTTEQLIEQMREQLASQARARNESLAFASTNALPAVAMAQLLGRPPRLFLTAQDSWIPRSHSGLLSEYRAEAEELMGDCQWVIDPATVCLIVECQIQTAVAAGGKKPIVTAESRVALRKWQLSERQDKKGSRGWMYLDARGRLRIAELGAATRKANTNFWRRLWQFVERECVYAESATDDTMYSLRNWADVLDGGSLSSIATSSDLGAVLLSDELVVRAAAKEIGSKSASLRGVVLQAIDRRLLSVGQGIRAIAALCRTGRSFFSISGWMLTEALKLPSHERWPALRALLSTVRAGDPITTWPILLTALAHNARLRISTRRLGVDERAFAKLVFRSAPRSDAFLAKVLVGVAVGSRSKPPQSMLFRGAAMRQLRRMLRRAFLKRL